MAKITPPDPRVPSPCMCVIVQIQRDRTVTSPCRKMTPGPDIPFCDECEDRHPFESEANLVTITTKPLPTDKEHVHDQR